MKKFKYTITTLDDNRCEINIKFGFFKNIKELKIPSEVDGYKVVNIGKTTGGSLRDKVTIHKLIIPNTVEHICDSAFSNFVNIKELVFEEDSQIKLIGPCAFYNTGITKLDINARNSLEICNKSFKNICIEELDLSRCLNIERFGESCFSGSSIKTVKLPSNIRDLAKGMFRDNNITDISFLLDLDRCSTIPFGCFSHCYITSIPDEVFEKYYIDEYAFESNEFEKLRLPECARLGHGAFMFNDKLKRVFSNISVIPSGLFRCCDNLEKVVIRNAVEIQADAFKQCAIKDLIFEDDKIQTIEGDAFSANNIQKVSLEHTNLNMLGYRAFAENQLKSVDLPYYVSVIYEDAFEYNKELAPLDLSKYPFAQVL